MDSVDASRYEDDFIGFDPDFRPSWAFYLAVVFMLCIYPFIWIKDKFEEWRENRKFRRSLRG